MEVNDQTRFSSISKNRFNLRAFKKALFRIDFLLAGLLVLNIVIRLYGIENPFVDFSSWRQIDTVSIAKSFATDNFNILHPQLLYDGPGPNYSQLELQITTFFIGLLFKFVGIRELYARIIPVMFFTGSVLFLYLFTKRYQNRNVALLTALIYSMLPMAVYYGRVVQPEPAMLFFGIASLFAFSLWLEKRTTSTYILATMAGVLSILAKIPNAFLLLPVAIMAISVLKKETFKNKQVYAYFTIVLSVTLVYFLYLGWFSANAGSPYDYHDYTHIGKHTSSFVSNIASKHIVPQLLSSAISDEGKLYLREYLINAALTPIGFILMLAGLIVTLFESKKHGFKSIAPFYAWAAAIVLYVLTIATTIKIDYYLVPVIPIASFFIARFLAVFVKNKITWPIAFVLVGLVGYQSFIAITPLYSLDTESYKAGVELQKELRQKEPVILGTYNPAILYYSNHKGWRSVDLSLDEFSVLKSKGAGYYIPLNSARDSKLVDYISKNYRLLSTRSGCKYYDLKNPIQTK
jgi:4-amino-4-deoxy-L-arabinose transferase-like glycosyltransferase